MRHNSPRIFIDIKTLIKRIVISHTTPAGLWHGQAVLVSCMSSYRPSDADDERQPWHTSLCGPICNSVDDAIHGGPFSNGRTDQRALRESPIAKSED